MNTRQVHQILKDTDFVHTSGTEQELQVANYLAAQCEKLGVKAHLEAFGVPMADMHESHLYCDGKEIPGKGYRLCGNGDVEAEFLYLPDTDPASLVKAKGKIVLLDGGLRHFVYQDLLEAGIAGVITASGNVNYRDSDVDDKELRAAVVADGKKIPCFHINVKDAMKLVRNKTKTARIVINETEYDGESHDVVAEIPGTSDEWIAFTAHMDTTPLSRGQYDNMTGCIGLLGIMEQLAKTAPNRYGLRFIFCGSEERGLLGSKAYVAAHEAELDKCALCINLDMIGSTMGHFIACCSSEQKLADYIAYTACMQGWGIKTRVGVYSSDSTPFADKGVPAVSFARLTNPGQGSIHERYDTAEILSDEQIVKDTEFIAGFSASMAKAFKCPVSKTIPDNIKKELDEYLNRKRKA